MSPPSQAEAEISVSYSEETTEIPTAFSNNETVLKETTDADYFEEVIEPETETDEVIVSALLTQGEKTNLPEEETAAVPVKKRAGKIYDEVYDEDSVCEITISAVGDCTFGIEAARGSYAGSFNDYYDRYGSSYFFENVKHIFAESDLAIANLEGPLTESNNIDKKEYNYKGHKEYTDALVDGYIDVVNLENNHTFDYGRNGYNDTTAALDDANIGYFGNGTVYITDIKGVKIGLISSMGTDPAQYRLNKIKSSLDYLDKCNVDIKIITFHWGTMLEPVADSRQKTIARFAIDNGADLVIGHHPHILQGVEEYNGGYIAYSLGNFIFDMGVRTEDRAESMILKYKFYVKGKEIVDKKAELIPTYVTSSFDRGVNDYKPVILEGEDKARVLEKIRTRSS